MSLGPGNDMLGSIPACAGEPLTRISLTPTPKVYPRVCGGTALSQFLLLGFQGLSPRVRGNLVSLGPGNDMLGSIPACAGEPDSVQATSRPRPVYPRVCGGTVFEDVEGLLGVGLSPRVRGNLS